MDGLHKDPPGRKNGAYVCIGLAEFSLIAITYCWKALLGQVGKVQNTVFGQKIPNA